MSDRVTLAAVAGAHGIGGEVRLKLFAEGVDSLARHAAVRVGTRDLALLSVRAAGPGAIARLEGVADRDAAEALRGLAVTVARTALPPLAEGEYYHADLIGLACVDPEGGALGTVAGVENFGAGDILEIETPAGRRHMVPFRPGIADPDDGRIRIDPVFLA